ncbi:hypothetical protein [Bacillus cereus group sp. BfR-BA-01382]|uniref:hypothetical protein n=1 Tax=Bacillus cereus group sp. BfR-BA-01382 TaxID=2920326 RepID=UPI001F574722
MLTVATGLVFCILLGIAFHADCELGRLRDDINQLTQDKKMQVKKYEYIKKYKTD